jgi:hypothetical protein
MRGKYLLALMVIAVFLTVSVAPVLAASSTYSGKITVIVWNRDTKRPYANTNLGIWITQGPYTTCTGKPPHLNCPGVTARTIVRADYSAGSSTDAWGRQTFSIPADDYHPPSGNFVTGQPATVLVYALTPPCNTYNDVLQARACCVAHGSGYCHYNVYGPYYLLGFFGTNVMFVSFSFSD